MDISVEEAVKSPQDLRTLFNQFGTKVDKLWEMADFDHEDKDFELFQQMLWEIFSMINQRIYKMGRK